MKKVLATLAMVLLLVGLYSNFAQAQTNPNADESVYLDEYLQVIGMGISGNQYDILEAMLDTIAVATSKNATKTDEDDARARYNQASNYAYMKMYCILMGKKPASVIESSGIKIALTKVINHNYRCFQAVININVQINTETVKVKHVKIMRIIRNPANGRWVVQF